MGGSAGATEKSLELPLGEKMVITQEVSLSFFFFCFFLFFSVATAEFSPLRSTRTRLRRERRTWGLSDSVSKMSFGLSSPVGCLRTCRKRKQSVDLAGDVPGRKGAQTVEEKRGFELLRQQKYCVFIGNRPGCVSAKISLLFALVHKNV